MRLEFRMDEFHSTLDYFRKAYRDNHDYVVSPPDRQEYTGYEINCFQTYFFAQKKAEAEGMQLGELEPLIIAMNKAIRELKEPSERVAVEYEPKNHLIMQEENVEFLKNNVKYLGFGEQISEDMVKQINAGNPEFTLETSSIHWDKTIDYKLHFRQSEETGRYFFNRYEAKLTDADSDKVLNQTFYIQKGKGFTAKEAYNLLEGRFVHKEMLNKENEKYTAHMKLDFDQTDDRGNFKFVRYSEAYGYKLEDTLAKVPIKEMQDADAREQLIKSLDRGNLQMVTIDTGDHLGRYYITPDPVKGLNMFDEKFKAVDPKDLGLNLRFKRNLGETEREKVESKNETQGKAQKQAEQPVQKQDKKQKMKVS